MAAADNAPGRSLVSLPEQLPLLTSEQLPDTIFETDERRGFFTGERLAVRDPERYRSVVSLLAEGLGVRTIARLLRVSAHTVQAVRDREPDAVATLKKEIVRNSRQCSRLCLEAIRDLLLDPEAKLSLRELGIVHGILTDKAELLDGQPTQRVDVGIEGPRHSELEDWLSSIRAQAVARRAERGEMGLGGETGWQKGDEAIDVTDEVDVDATQDQDVAPGGQGDGLPVGGHGLERDLEDGLEGGGLKDDSRGQDDAGVANGDADVAPDGQGSQGDVSARSGGARED
jgi:hypothetical protein